MLYFGWLFFWCFCLIRVFWLLLLGFWFWCFGLVLGWGGWQTLGIAELHVKISEQSFKDVPIQKKGSQKAEDKLSLLILKILEGWPEDSAFNGHSPWSKRLKHFTQNEACLLLCLKNFASVCTQSTGKLCESFVNYIPESKIEMHRNKKCICNLARKNKICEKALPIWSEYNRN